MSKLSWCIKILNFFGYKMKNIKIMAIWGGTCVGKSEYASVFQKLLGSKCIVISSDSYYDIWKINEVPFYTEFDMY